MPGALRPILLAAALALVPTTAAGAAAAGPAGGAAEQASGSAPSRSACRATRAGSTAPPLRSFSSRPGGVRVFAMQFKQEARHVTSYASFRRKIECMVREYVLPHRSRRVPNVVAFNEDVGLLTPGIGSRGARARATAAPGGAPQCAGQDLCATIATLTALDSGYTREIGFYRARFGAGVKDNSAALLGATDTSVRAWVRTFSDLARRYRVYILGSSALPPFRESTDPAEIDALRDPDLPRPRSVFVATAPEVYNEAIMWGPRDVRRSGPGPLRNAVQRNRKVPLTGIELALQFAPGPATGPEAVANVRPYRIPGSRARTSFATSLPAFRYGDPPPGVDPCSDTAQYYMRCLDRLGTNLVMQDEANPGRWANVATDSYWQPLNWMGSTWRAASDPSVDFDYNVTPHMVGNLADLPFDGQTAITQRGLGAGRPAPRGCKYVGNATAQPGDSDQDRPYAGAKREFLALVPWVRPDGSRDALRAIAAKLAAGSGDPLENDYLETAAIADLPYPPDPRRRQLCPRR